MDRLRWRAVFAIGSLLAGCSRGPTPDDAGVTAATARARDSAYPVRLRDDRGALVTVLFEPRRIVALLPSHTETLFALGVGARVVGVDDYSDHPPEVARLPKLGGMYDAHLEGVFSLKPDLVLCSESSGAAGRLEQGGLTVWAGGARTFDDVFRVIGAIGEMVNRAAQAAQLSNRIAEDVAAIEAALRGREPVEVYYELDANLYTVGPASFIGVLLTKAGGHDIVPSGLGDFPKISSEAVISGHPSVILGVTLEEAARRPGWTQITAVQTGRVYKLPKEEAALIVRPGPRIAEGVRALARRLHPEVAP